MDILLRLCLILGACFSDVEQREYTVTLPAPIVEVVEVEVEDVIYPYPEYISVRVTGVQECDDVNGKYTRVDVVPFMDYVKGVLANEWGANWDETESLRAGAVAVKMYAWNAVLNGGKWGGFENGNVYDCDWDMVYNPEITREAHSQAVEDTWAYYMIGENGEPVRKVHFLAWYGACIGWLGDNGDCMGQWNSLADAENGMLFDEILEKYYYNSEVVEIKGANYERQ